MILTYILVIISSLSFMYYGIMCLVSPVMLLEFQRYGLSNFRILTGILQNLGSLGLLIGLYIPFIGAISAAGLGLLMLSGFVVRLKIRDGFRESAPSIIFMALNFYILFLFLSNF